MSSNQQKLYNQNKSKKNRIESANTNFTSDILRNKENNHFYTSNKSFYNNSRKPFVNLSSYSSFNEKTENNIYNSNLENVSCGNNKPRQLSSYKPRWKYSYFMDKNQILNVENQSEIKNNLVDYKDIDKKPQKIVYSWTKPRMVQIIEKNGIIEEEVRSHPWKYSYLFGNKVPKAPGKLLKIMMAQLSQGANKGFGYMNYNNKFNNYYSDEINNINNISNRDSDSRKNTKSGNGDNFNNCGNENYLMEMPNKKIGIRPKTALNH